MVVLHITIFSPTKVPVCNYYLPFIVYLILSCIQWFLVAVSVIIMQSIVFLTLATNNEF